MKTPKNVPTATHAVLVLAEIKAAIAAFDRGAINVFDALDAVAVAVEALRGGQRGRPPRLAAERPPAAA